MRPTLEVADIVRAHGDEFRRAHAASLSPRQKRALRNIELCRTATLGGHLERCDQCGHERNAYNSCVMESNFLWGVGEWLSIRFKLFALIQAIPDTCELPITKYLFCRRDMEESMPGWPSMPVMISKMAGASPACQSRKDGLIGGPSDQRDLGIRLGSTRPTGAVHLGSRRFLMERKSGVESLSCECYGGQLPIRNYVIDKRFSYL